MAILLQLLPYVSSAIILIAFLIALRYIRSVPQDQIKSKQNWMEQLPALISTLGVIGTFLGITVGLIAFNSNDLDRSIPLFLDGLRTAFFTSLLGMAGSLILNRALSKKLSDVTEKSGLQQAIRDITETLNKNNSALINAISNDSGFSTDDISDIKSNIKGLASDLRQIKDDVEELKDLISVVSDIKEATDDIRDTSTSIDGDIDRTRAVLMTATASIATIDNNLEEIRQNMPEKDEA